MTTEGSRVAVTQLRLAVPVAVVLGLLLWFATRSDMRWVAVFEADAATRQSVELELLLDFCDTNVTVPAAHVTETVSEVHVLIPLKVRDYGDSKACAGLTTVRLRSPIGSRSVIDDRTHKKVKVVFSGS